jgi:dUTPase
MARRPHPLSASVRVKKLVEEALLPRQMTDGSADLNIHACITGPVGKIGIGPGERTLVGTGIAVAIDEGYFLHLTSVNPHLVAELVDKHGELVVALLNTSPVTQIVEHEAVVARGRVLASAYVEIREVLE